MSTIIRALLLIIAWAIFINPLYAETDTPDVNTLLIQAKQHIKEWDIGNAEETAVRAFELAANDQDKSQSYYLRSIVEFYKGNYQTAEEYGKKAIDLGLPEAESDLLRFILSAANNIPEFNEARTEHFIIRYAHPKDAIIAHYGKDVLEKSHFEIGLDLQTYPEVPVIVEIYPDMESFTLASTLPAESVKNTGVVGICKFNRIMVLSPRLMPKGYTWADTLAHEYTHYLVFLRSGNTMPVWLHEGIAKFQENRWNNQNRDVLSPFYETILARALKDGSLVPIEKMHPSLALLDSAHEAQLAFGQASTTVSFMVERWGDDSITDLMVAVREKGDYKAAIKKVTGLEFQEFYQSWKEYLHSKELKEVIPGIKVKGIRISNNEDKPSDDSEDLIEIDNVRARDYTRLGDLLRSRGRLRPAAFEYEQALGYDPYSPIISSRLSSALYSSGEYKRARQVIDPLLILYPDHMDILMTLGRIYLLEGNLNKAEQAFLNANTINPFDPEIHLALVKIYNAQGKEDLTNSEKSVLEILLNEDKEIEH